MVLVFLNPISIPELKPPRGKNLEIPVAVHEILSETGRGYVPAEVIQEQIDVLNHGFSVMPIRFRLVYLDWVVNDKWHDQIDGLNDDGVEMEKTYLSKPQFRPDRVLNIFVVNLGVEWNGYSSFPWETDRDVDAILLHYATLPHPSSTEFNGATLVHETGHWLGLYHTFQGGCNGAGDGVDDTPPEAGPSRDGLPRSTCGGADPVTNVMDYSPDPSPHVFTKGQIARVHEMIMMYRTGLLSH